MKKTFNFKAYLGICFFLFFQMLSAQVAEPAVIIVNDTVPTIEVNYSKWSVAPVFGYKQIKTLSIFDLGVVVTKSIAKGHRINLDLSYRTSGSNLDQYWHNTPMKMKVDIGSLVAGVGYNWFPFVANGVHGDFLKSITVMGGLWYVSKPEYIFDASLVDPLVWGDLTFSTEEIGMVATTIKTNKVQPYLGLGFNQFYLGNKVNLVVNGGILYQGKPEVTMVATNMLKPSEESAARLQDNMSVLEVAPFVQLALQYNF
jgi:hypothetical protein